MTQLWDFVRERALQIIAFLITLGLGIIGVTATKWPVYFWLVVFVLGVVFLLFLIFLWFIQRPQRLFPPPGPYTLLALEYHWIIHDQAGAHATLYVKKELCFTENHIIAIPHLFWGDGQPPTLSDFQFSDPTIQAVALRREANKYILLISLPHEYHRGDRLQLEFNQIRRDSFCNPEREWVEVSAIHRVKSVGMTVSLPPGKSISTAYLLHGPPSSLVKTQLPQSSFSITKNQQGATIYHIKWSKRNPSLNHTYRIEWYWA